MLSRGDIHVCGLKLTQLRKDMVLDMAKLRKDLHRDMTQLRDNIHRDTVMLHERVAVMETRQNQRKRHLKADHER